MLGDLYGDEPIWKQNLKLSGCKKCDLLFLEQNETELQIKEMPGCRCAFHPTCFKEYEPCPCGKTKPSKSGGGSSSH